MCTALFLHISSFRSRISWLAGGKALKVEAHLFLSLFAAFHSYLNSAQENISAHHHGGNCNVTSPKLCNHKTRTMIAHFGNGVRELKTKLPGNTGFWKLF